MDKLAAMTVFVAIVDHGSMTEASRRIGKSLPAIARTLKGLEASLGTQLLIRTARQPVVTPEGQAYYRACKRLLADIASVEAEFAQGPEAATNDIRLTAPILFGQKFVAPSLARLHKAQPDLRFHVLLEDAPVSLSDGKFDLAIRIGFLEDSDLRARRIGEMNSRLVAAPAFLRRHGPVTDIAQLATLPSVNVDISGRRSGAVWTIADRNGQLVKVAHAPVLHCNTIDFGISACIAGIGLGGFYSYQVADALADGSLVTVLDDHPGALHPVHLVRPNIPYVPDYLTQVIDSLERDLRKVLKTAMPD